MADQTVVGDEITQGVNIISYAEQVGSNPGCVAFKPIVRFGDSTECVTWDGFKYNKSYFRQEVVGLESGKDKVFGNYLRFAGLKSAYGSYLSSIEQCASGS